MRLDFLGHAKGAGLNAIRAGDATRGVGAVDDAKLVLRDGVGRADFRADRVLAVHADLDRGLRGQEPIHVIHMDHRGLPVGFALGAGHLAGVAPDATLRVEEELQVRAKRGGVHALA